ncbi:nucleobindin-2-like [Limulus polyphemus]|uniref:Nucleobindin-2-like n=1 Tax=Limulus polyphemus TaxID=6850 RepID=A0ABM1TM55_LIMPO|nr:nucleobindin-2-like [Limulus polyphemus]
MKKLLVILVALCLFEVTFAAPRPVDKKKGTEEEAEEELDDFGLEYGRYLQQIVQALEEDKDFARKLENVSADQIKTGEIARELEFVKHSVRSKLDELKRMEVERLRRLTREEIERTELGLYRDEDGHLLPAPPEGREWRTIPRPRGGKGFNRKNIKVPVHLDPANPHTFEVEDLKKLIKTATKDLEELDRRRREEFKQYEMEKEHQYRESLHNLTQEERNEIIKKHEEMEKKHKDHPRIHHPGSKPQLEQVWEERDHMPREEFDPRVFFFNADINGDGYLDEDEVEAILSLEVRKMYDPNNPEDDPVEMMEEYNRMREHIYNEADKDKDKRISRKEFLDLTQQDDFEKDEGWKGIDEQLLFTEEEMKEYEKQRAAQLQKHFEAQRQAANIQGVPPQYVYYPPPQQYGVPPQYAGHQGIPPALHDPPSQHLDSPQQPGHQNIPQQQKGMPHQVNVEKNNQHHQGVPPQNQFQQQQFQGVPQQQQFQGVPQQQQFQGVPQQQQFQGVPQQQQFQGVPQHQQFQGVPQHQQFQGVPQHQQFQGVPQHQQFQGVPQHQQFQGGPQHQQFQGGPQHQQQQGVPQHQQQQGVPQQQQGGSQHQQQQGVPQHQQQQGVPQHQQQQGVPQHQQGIPQQHYQVQKQQVLQQAASQEPSEVVHQKQNIQPEASLKEGSPVSQQDTKQKS